MGVFGEQRCLGDHIVLIMIFVAIHYFCQQLLGAAFIWLKATVVVLQRGAKHGIGVVELSDDTFEEANGNVLVFSNTGVTVIQEIRHVDHCLTVSQGESEVSDPRTEEDAIPAGGSVCVEQNGSHVAPRSRISFDTTE